jgi:hypothetical protein
MRNGCRSFIENAERILRHRSEDKFKMDLKVVGYEDAD